MINLMYIIGIIKSHKLTKMCELIGGTYTSLV